MAVCDNYHDDSSYSRGTVTYRISSHSGRIDIKRHYVVVGVNIAISEPASNDEVQWREHVDDQNLIEDDSIC